MEIWLLLTVVGIVSSKDVNKPQLHVTEGSYVELPCNLWPKDMDQCRVFWHFNPNEPSETGYQDLDNKTFSNCSSALPLSLDSVTQNHSGWYRCKSIIEIPVLRMNYSNWTRLVVGSEKPPVEPVLSDWWMWIVVGASGFVVVILLILCLVLRWRRLKQRDLEHSLYINTHRKKQPSPQPKPRDNNTLKTESCYQNLRTPDVNKRYENSRRLSPNR